VPPVDDPIGDEIDPCLEDLAVGAVERTDEGLARKGHPYLEVPRYRLVGFVQVDGLEHHPRAEIVRLADGSGRAADLVRRQRVERMARRGDRTGFSNDGVRHSGPLDVRNGGYPTLARELSNFTGWARRASGSSGQHLAIHHRVAVGPAGKELEDVAGESHAMRRSPSAVLAATCGVTMRLSTPIPTSAPCPCVT